jgi:ubiquinone biosynthesis protein COQ9
MRYLKTFENLNYFTKGVSEIETFIKNNLAYILDEGFTYKVNFKYYGGRMNYIIKIHKIEQKGNNRRELIFNWEELKDDIIPFLELLNDAYTLDSYSPEDKSLVIDSGEIDNNIKKRIKRWYSIEELIDDTVGDIKLQFISFVITGEK